LTQWRRDTHINPSRPVSLAGGESGSRGLVPPIVSQLAGAETTRKAHLETDLASFVADPDGDDRIAN
jgi:hypothetical protein